MELEIKKTEICGKAANYYIKEPTTEGDIRIYLCKEHTVDLKSYYFYMFNLEGIKACQESI